MLHLSHPRHLKRRVTSYGHRTWGPHLLFPLPKYTHALHLSVTVSFLTLFTDIKIQRCRFTLYPQCDSLSQGTPGNPSQLRGWLRPGTVVQVGGEFLMPFILHPTVVQEERWEARAGLLHSWTTQGASDLAQGGRVK